MFFFIIQTSRDVAVDENGSGVGGERGTETVNTTEVEVGRLRDVDDVGLKG